MKVAKCHTTKQTTIRHISRSKSFGRTWVGWSCYLMGFGFYVFVCKTNYNRITY